MLLQGSGGSGSAADQQETKRCTKYLGQHCSSKLLLFQFFGGGTVRLCGFTSPSGSRIVIVSFHPLPFKYLPSRATMLALISWRAKEREREAMKKKGIHGEFRDGTVLSNQNGKRKTERSLQLELPRWKRHQSLSLSLIFFLERGVSRSPLLWRHEVRERERERELSTSALKASGTS